MQKPLARLFDRGLCRPMVEQLAKKVWDVSYEEAHGQVTRWLEDNANPNTEKTYPKFYATGREAELHALSQRKRFAVHRKRDDEDAPPWVTEDLADLTEGLNNETR
jgi:hypothetical protein